MMIRTMISILALTLSIMNADAAKYFSPSTNTRPGACEQDAKDLVLSYLRNQILFRKIYKVKDLVIPPAKHHYIMLKKIADHVDVFQQTPLLRIYVVHVEAIDVKTTEKIDFDLCTARFTDPYFSYLNANHLYTPLFGENTHKVGNQERFHYDETGHRINKGEHI